MERYNEAPQVLFEADMSSVESRMVKILHALSSGALRDDDVRRALDRIIASGEGELS